MRWLSSRTPVTYFSKLLGIRCVAAFLQRELFKAYIHENIKRPSCCRPDTRSRHPACNAPAA
ncbi:hypothetical protein CWM66_19670 [Kosakonia sp. H7A]|nr:hypothetical protein AW40_14985 [Kosakonia radicincitans UMEnt01/12]NCF06010.1 hypothetical protein [Kosakonia sp. MH5]PTA89310.1 hypothetical protein CWM66_19670 [Kosakonia sp. H7A]